MCIRDRYRDRILRTDVNITLICTDCIAGNCHRFDNDVRIALQNRTIHKRARIALIGVAADVFLIRLICSRERPFHTGREAAAAASTQSGILIDFDNSVSYTHLDVYKRQVWVHVRHRELA